MTRTRNQEPGTGASPVTPCLHRKHPHGTTRSPIFLLLPLLALLAGCVAVEPIPGGSYQATVLWVMDGDSLRARIDGREYDLRLWGIDAPERDQSGAEAARAALRALIDGRSVSLDVVTVDQYERLVVRLQRDGLDVNLEQIRNGHAWWFKRFAAEAVAYREAEHDARAARRGLWQEDAPEAPWAYRDRQQ